MSKINFAQRATSVVNAATGFDKARGALEVALVKYFDGINGNEDLTKAARKCLSEKLGDRYKSVSARVSQLVKDGKIKLWSSGKGARNDVKDKAKVAKTIDKSAAKPDTVRKINADSIKADMELVYGKETASAVMYWLMECPEEIVASYKAATSK